MIDKSNWWNVELESKPDFEKAMERIYAWYENEITDRAPIRFFSHNEQNEQILIDAKGHQTLKDRWFDVDYQIDLHLSEIKTKKYLAENKDLCKELKDKILVAKGLV